MAPTLRKSIAVTLLAALNVLLPCHEAAAALPKDVRRELGRLSREARRVPGLVRHNQIDQARRLVESLQERAAALDIADDETDRTWRTFQRHLDRARRALPVRFETDIAPILREHCLNCHGADRAEAGLRLDTFRGLRQGSRSGALLRPGSARNSLIIARLTASDSGRRMPRRADPLTETQIRLIARWIDGGAVFDGKDETAPIGTSAVPPEDPVNVPAADGTETVSFVRDVAPIFVTFCLRCHRGREPRGGFSVETVEHVLRGGDSGSTIVPGNADDSYLWHLVGLQDPIKMPQGPALLRRSQAMTIRTWINEGATFDGSDPRASLRSLVPTEAEKEAQRLRSMSDEEFQQRRIDQAETLWKRAAAGEPAESIITEHFVVRGNVPAERLQHVADLAEDQIRLLQARHSQIGRPCRGRLILFVCRDRFGYTEFDTVLLDRQTPAGISGHVVITSRTATAWAAMHDFPGSGSVDGLTSDRLVRRLVSEAWILHDGRRLPEWLQTGFGIVASEPDARTLKRLKPVVDRAVQRLADPEDVFHPDAADPADVPVLGAFLIRFLQSGRSSAFPQYVQAVRSGDDPAEAAASVYGQPAAAIGRQFLRSLNR